MSLRKRESKTDRQRQTQRERQTRETRTNLAGCFLYFRRLEPLWKVKEKDGRHVSEGRSVERTKMSSGQAGQASQLDKEWPRSGWREPREQPSALDQGKSCPPQWGLSQLSMWSQWFSCTNGTLAFIIRAISVVFIQRYQGVIFYAVFKSLLSILAFLKLNILSVIHAILSISIMLVISKKSALRIDDHSWP